MRVVIVSQHFPPENSGNASRVSDMARKMAEAGVDVTVLAPHPTFPTGTFPRSWRWRRTYTWRGVKLVNLWAWQPAAKDPGFPSRVLYYLTFPVHATLWALWNAKRYDLIIGSMPPVFTGMPGLFAAKLRRKTFVVEVRDLWIDAAVSMGFVTEKSLFTRLSRWFERKCIERAALVGGTTEDVIQKIRKRFNVGDKPAVVVPNGVDTTAFRPISVEKRPIFVYAGNIGHAQDLETIILAIGIVRRTRPEARLVLAGDGDTRERLVAFARARGLDEAVEFPGVLARDVVPSLYASAIAGLAPLRDLPSLEYAVPTKAYEAMACGVPFIGTGIGEIARLAKESGGGVMATNDPDAVAAAMLRLLADPTLAAALGAKGRAYVEAHYDRGAIARAYVAKLEGLHV